LHDGLWQKFEIHPLADRIPEMTGNTSMTYDTFISN